MSFFSPINNILVLEQASNSFQNICCWLDRRTWTSGSQLFFVLSFQVLFWLNIKNQRFGAGCIFGGSCSGAGSGSEPLLKIHNTRYADRCIYIWLVKAWHCFWQHIFKYFSQSTIKLHFFDDIGIFFQLSYSATSFYTLLEAILVVLI